MKSVVVTGASTGIGLATAKVLAAKGLRVFGSVRKSADAARLEQELGPRFSPLVFDVTDEAAVAGAAHAVRAALAGDTLSGLVNNAGIAVPGPLLHLPLDEFRRQLDVNLTGQLIVTQAFAPLLGANTQAGAKGRIVMMSSVGGRNALPFVGAYNASKFALEGLSEALRRELMLFGIDVIVIAPGAIATPIWDKAQQVDLSAYLTTPYGKSATAAQAYFPELGRKGLAPERIGHAVWRALTAKKPKVRYTVTPDPLENILVHALPKRLVDRIVAGRLGLLPPARSR